MPATSIDYVGTELGLFAHAPNWKRYLRDRLGAFIRGDVAEVGAGGGATTMALVDSPQVASWLSIEPDSHLSTALARELANHPSRIPIHAVAGTLGDQALGARFDTILYIDVLEHIADDRGEVSEAAKRLRPGGKLVVLCPAFPFLYSRFDAAIGHHRRYTRTTLRALGNAELVEEAGFYMDCAGALASLANKLVLRRSMPSQSQVRVWDRALVPLSRLLDPVMPWFGKSVVVVWRRV